MKMLRPLARRLLRLNYVRRAVADKADLGAFKARPSVRLVAGVLLIGLGQLMGLPAVAGFTVAAAWLREPLVLLGGPVSYIVSWGVWTLGMWLAGPDNIMYLNVLLRWTVRRFVVWQLGGEAEDMAGEED